ncbi:MAG: tetratricopeptide repeat protein [Proteobacteria bacterium]|jgi:tetratricopeptide (TPR) repeat protein|nr:tetratricopeptide repeat protein [Pseudomonadota bacterium]
MQFFRVRSRGLPSPHGVLHQDQVYVFELNLNVQGKWHLKIPCYKLDRETWGAKYEEQALWARQVLGFSRDARDFDWTLKSLSDLEAALGTAQIPPTLSEQEVISESNKLRDASKSHEAEAVLTEGLEKTGGAGLFVERALLRTGWLGNFNGAIADCERALELAPGFPEARQQLAVALEAAGQVDDAVACLQQAVEADPVLVDNWQILAQMLIRAGRLKEAEPCTGRWVELRKDSAFAVVNRARVLLGIGRLNDAKKAFDRLKLLAPDYQHGWYWRGRYFYEGRRMYRRAKEAFTQSIECGPDYAWNAYYWRGMVENHLGEYQAALDDLDVAWRMAPSHIPIRFERAFSRWKLGRLSEALEDIDAYIAVVNDYPPAHVQRAKIVDDLAKSSKAY